ncbi:hypothetical protein ACFYZ4_37200 [Streptomyces sp. NPDC001513]|uniref:hypothetical protein n=1 Tax=Streptomyces sp. NPDC001513 TaxID=3364580 RepID=UPI00368853A6
MAVHALKRRLGALGTVLGLGVTLPLTVGVTPASAAPQLSITKSHTGDFTRGGQGVYRITVVNSGDQPTQAPTRMTDVFPAGLTNPTLAFVNTTLGVNCYGTSDGVNRWDCDTPVLPPGGGYTVDITVDVATDAPCAVTNTVTVVVLGSDVSDAASDPTNIPGPNCNGGGGGGAGGGSLLPVNLSGLIPMFNNISTNNNIKSPGATNRTSQGFDVNGS